ncbi:MAG: cyclic pyranopterin monophosphate synthase MoaC [Polyangiales bacterium]
MAKRAAKKTGLSHLDARGHARVVDVGEKAETRRRAEARAVLRTTPEVAAEIRGGTVPKGDVTAVARIAAISATKRTSDLIPLCHPLPLTHVTVEVNPKRDGRVVIDVACECVGRTGVEMEAMTGASIGALAIYDMIKGMDRGARVESVELLAKSGGKSGTWRRT